MSRRTVLQGLAASLGVAGTAPIEGAEAVAHPIAAHVAQRRPAGTKRTTTPAVPRFLDQHQRATLAAAADLIVPGAVASGSPQFIDEVLAVERPAVQQRFVGALGALDAAARARYQQPFKNLTRARQVAVLDAAAAAPVSAEPAAAAQADPERAKPTEPRVALGDPLSHLKTWVAGAHFSSEAGMTQLGWTGGMFFTAATACPHPEGHE